MPLTRYIWLLLCYANLARSSLTEQFQDLLSERGQPPLQVLPVALEEQRSGCTCRSNQQHDLVVCFGFYSCIFFPKLGAQSEAVKVKSTAMSTIMTGETDYLYEIKILEIDSNRNLATIQPYAFKKLSKLEHLSISYNPKLMTLNEYVFIGLTNLANLTLRGNGFMKIEDATRALTPNSLPAIQSIDLSENWFKTMTETDLIFMNGSSVKQFALVLCYIDYIHPKALLYLPMLKSLNIGENNLNATNIGEVLLELQKIGIQLNLLDLSRMGFRKAPPKHLLEIISHTTITRLILAQNQFELIWNHTFPRMHNIELLDLRQVLAVTLDADAFGPDNFPNLKILLLSGNNLLGVQARLSTKLKYLDLSDNTGRVYNPGYFAISPDSFQNMSNLEALNLSFNRIITLYNFTFQGLHHLKTLNLKNGSIFRVESQVFKPLSNLKMLSLENNPFLQDNENLTADLFEGLAGLQVLILSNCRIQTLNDDFLTVLPNLTRLILKNNKIITLTPEVLKPVKHLKFLDLSNNLVVSWLSPLFKPSRASISYLGMNNNKIARFTMSMLDDIEYILNNANNSDVQFQGNVFVCDCSTMYPTFSWMSVNTSERLNKFFDESSFTCTTPSAWEHKRVASYLTTYHGLNCSIYHSKIIVVVYTIVTIFIILLGLFTGVMIYIYRIYVRYWIFLAKLALGRRHLIKTAKDLGTKTAFKYDAFVSYSAHDRDFVVQMIAELETNRPYLKLCVYERDFIIGSYISEAIQKGISDSKFIILIVSDHFAKSQWCRWETQLADYHRLFLDGSYNYDPLILVRMGEILPKNLTPTLKYLLKTKIYLNWENKEKADEFWRKLRDILQKS